MKDFIQSGIHWGDFNFTLVDVMIIVLIVIAAQSLIWFLRGCFGSGFPKNKH